MAIHDAAKLLQAKLQGSSWLTAVGVGEEQDEPCIVVYVKSLKSADTGFLKDGWKGFPVVIRKMGVPRLVASASPSNRR